MIFKSKPGKSSVSNAIRLLKPTPVLPPYEQFLKDYDKYVAKKEVERKQEEELKTKNKKFKERIFTPEGGEEIAAEALMAKITRRKNRKKHQVDGKKMYNYKKNVCSQIVTEYLELYDKTKDMEFIKKANVHIKYATDEQKSLIRNCIQQSKKSA